MMIHIQRMLAGIAACALLMVPIYVGSLIGRYVDLMLLVLVGCVVAMMYFVGAIILDWRADRQKRRHEVTMAAARRRQSEHLDA